ncbi:RNase H domain-containing protein [Aphis craccivora]|uniref:RNase H domain-containing protein n=1 Tax=Aphis craccivora TaxID=307492 RepID=A0A6G0YP61_APHCR|nr:RNase H domain-containing protein [Aphis craccivora]
MSECNTYRDAREHNQLPEDIFESLGLNLPVSNIIAFLQQTGLFKLI